MHNWFLPQWSKKHKQTSAPIVLLMHESKSWVMNRNVWASQLDLCISFLIGQMKAFLRTLKLNEILEEKRDLLFGGIALSFPRCMLDCGALNVHLSSSRGQHDDNKEKSAVFFTMHDFFNRGNNETLKNSLLPERQDMFVLPRRQSPQWWLLGRSTSKAVHSWWWEACCQKSTCKMEVGQNLEHRKLVVLKGEQNWVQQWWSNNLQILSHLVQIPCHAWCIIACSVAVIVVCSAMGTCSHISMATRQFAVADAIFQCNHGNDGESASECVNLVEIESFDLR